MGRRATAGLFYCLVADIQRAGRELRTHWRRAAGTWARVAPAAGEPTEFVLLGGSSLSFEGKPIFRAGRRTAFVLIRRFGEEAVIETDQGNTYLENGRPAMLS